MLILFAVGLVLAWCLAVGYVAWVLTHPPRRTYASAVARGRPGDPSELPGPARAWRSWSVRSRGLELPVWEVEGDAPRGPVLVLTHGWGDSRIGGLARLSHLARLASRLILWDLPAHGEAPGLCRLGTAEEADLLALIDQLSPRQIGEDERPRLVLYGWSLGAGLSIVAAASDDRIAAVIAEAPYRLPQTPAINVMRARALPWRTNLPPAFWLLGVLFGVGPRWAAFDRAAHAAALRCPLLVLHGEEDAISPPEDGRAIAEAAPQGRMAMIAGGGHNDLWTEPPLAEACIGAIAAFFAEQAGASGAAAEPRPGGRGSEGGSTIDLHPARPRSPQRTSP